MTSRGDRKTTSSTTEAGSYNDSITKYWEKITAARSYHPFVSGTEKRSLDKTKKKKHAHYKMDLISFTDTPHNPWIHVPLVNIEKKIAYEDVSTLDSQKPRCW